MVGVAGRSKACHTCKQRRKACSSERPACSQCIKTRRECTGYERQAVFVQAYASRDSTTNKVPDAPIADYSKQCITTLSKRPRGRPHRTISTHSNLSTGDDVVVAPDPARLFQQQFLSHLIESWEPKDLSGINDVVSWLKSIPDCTSISTALERSTLALSLARAGRINNNDTLVQESERQYGEGLKSLQHALMDRKRVRNDDTLGACMALVAYELMECPGGTEQGWISHQNGLAQLIRFRGPKAHADGLGHQIFLAFRLQGILLAAHQGTATFLSEPEWMDIPLKNKQDDKFDKLLRILVKAPAILRKANALPQDDPSALATACLDILDCLWDLDSSLQTFIEELQEEVAGPLYTPKFAQDGPSSDTGRNEEPRLFPVAFHFANLSIASTMLWYWALCTMVWPGMLACYRAIIELLGLDHANKAVNWSLQDAEHVRSRLKAYPPLDYRRDCFSMAWNICQSVEYCMQDCMRGAGPAALTGVLSIAYHTLREQQPQRHRELEWIWRARQNVSERALRFVSFVEP